MNTEFYLQTRGKIIDYRFLYEAPSSEWWRHYADYTLFEDETIILERLAGGKCRLYLSGIPSNRRDRVNTIIRYTLVAELSKGEVSEKAFQLVHKFLDDCRNKRDTLGASLDSCFQERDIEDALRSTGSSEKKRQDKISQKIADLVNSGSKSSSYNKYLEGIYWGGLLFDNSYEAWLSLASRILINGELGVAALLNATSEKSLLSLKEKIQDKGIENAFILLPDNRSDSELIEASKKDKRDMITSRFGTMTEGIRKIGSYSQTKASKIYLGVCVLFSAFVFLVFILAR